MNTAKVAEWLREAASKVERFEYNHGEGNSKEIRQRATQVEAMTCDGCRWWVEKERGVYGQCESVKVRESLGSIFFPAPSSAASIGRKSHE